MHFKRLLILILVGCNAGLRAQKPNVIPPSPNAASFSKFGDIPVNLSTGSANISVPIYPVKEGSLNWNVSLDYNYTGYRPSDGPGWAGRGFALPGGVITRTVHGLRDEGENGNEGYFTTGPAVNSSLTNAENGTSPDYTFLNYVVTGTKDAEPDMFQFSFGNYSGKFFFKSDGTIYSGGSQALKIVPELGVPAAGESSQNVGNTFTKWTITTEDGTQYIFSNAEYGWTLYGNESYEHFKTTVSAWHLSEIIGVNGERISFAYTLPSFNTKRLQASYTEKRTLQIPGGGGPPGYYVNSSTGGLVKNYSQEIFPTSISGSNWEIRFNSTLMQEFIGTETSNYRQLNSIDILDKNSGTAVPIKKFDFSYNASDMHLLEKLQESNGTTSINPYVFSYFNLNDVGVTSSIDYWGYYNASGNNSLLSEFGADRQPYLPGSQMGALQVLTYPTKGSSVFEYELNTASYMQTTFYQQHRLVYDYYGFVWRKTETGLELIQPQPEDPALTFTIPEARTYETNYSFDFPYDLPCHPTTATGTLQPGAYSADNFTPHPCFISEMPVGGEITIQIKVKRILDLDISPVGGLRIKKIKNYSAPNVLATAKEFKYSIFGEINRSSGALADSIETSSLFTTVFTNSARSTAQTWKSEPFNSLALSPVLYLNVEEITNSSSQYHYFSSYAAYGNVNGTLMSGGGTQSFGPVGNYDFARGMPVQTTRFRDNTHTAVSTESFSQYNLTSEQSPGIYYEMVASYTTPTSTNPDPITQHAYYVKGYRAVAGWIKKESSTELDYGTSGSVPVTTNTTYEYANLVHRLLTRQRVTQSDGSILETNFKYPPDYGSSGNAAVQSMVLNHMYAYPLEQVTWLEKSASDRKVITASATTYKSFTGNLVRPALLLPYKKFAFNGMNGSIGTFEPYVGATDETASATYRETLKYTDYDIQGNPLSLLVNGSDKISYLWAYKGQYPVAEIQNADNAGVLAALGGTTFAQMADMTDSPSIKTKLDAVRASLPDAMVTTYQYAPLVGVTTTTDPAGKSLIYEYDVLQRLSRIKDNSGNVRASYCYNYAGQFMSCDEVAITGTVAPSALSLIAETMNNIVKLNVKIFLQGAYTSGTNMRNDLKTGVNAGVNLLPLSQPYVSGHSPKTVYNGTESVTDFPINAVDWVLVQLRSAATGPVVAQRAGILLQNGDIVDNTAGFASPLTFPGLENGNYFIVVRHRNHLGVMSATAQALSSTVASYNFTTDNTKGYNLDGNNTPMKQLTAGLFGLWGGDINHDGQVYYYGPGSDAESLTLDYLHNNAENSYNNLYEDGDINMDGQTFYFGPGSDIEWLTNYPLGGNSNDGYLFEQVP